MNKRSKNRRRDFLSKGFTLLELTIVILVMSFVLVGVAKFIKVQGDFQQYQEAKKAAWHLRSELIGYAILHNRLPKDLSPITSNPHGFSYEVDSTALVQIFKEILEFNANPTLCIEPYSEDCNDSNAENIYAVFLITHPKYPEIKEWVTMSYLSGYASRGWVY